MRFFRIRDAVDMKDAMLIYGGVEIRRLDKSLQDPKEGDVYVKLRIWNRHEGCHAHLRRGRDTATG